MAELIGQNLTKHLDAILAEHGATGTIYGYPKRKMYRGFDGLDLGVDFHGRRAETVLGPASGPHTQMAQNIVLAFLGGARIMELKTVQILDELEIARPCIDVRNVGYNVEWSQELKLEDSFAEYVNAWILLKCIEELELLEVPRGAPFYDTIFDISVGYDLKGIRSDRMHNWLRDFKNAQTAIARTLASLPRRYAHLRGLAVEPNISNSVTLSTFHGCPADEIEAIVEHLIEAHGFHVIVKMNPTILGYDFVEQTLHQEMGYSDIQLDPDAFAHDVSFDEAVAMMKRLQKFAAQHRVNIGAKFTNTLVVKNNQNVFKDEVMYLSGAPLHVLSMNAMRKFRSVMGDNFHVSFSAGITKHNFVDAVLCNMCPITTCTDLLKEGGYSRLFDYLFRLQNAMKTQSCSTMNELICSAVQIEEVSAAGAENAGRIVPALVYNRYYHQGRNSRTPPKIDSHLELFDCITCNKCLPVCPNAANFAIETGKVEFPIVNLRWQNGRFMQEYGGLLRLKKTHQIANLADFCNECGDCDTYCPELGGPFIEKPRFFSGKKSYEKFSGYDGFYLKSKDELIARIDGREFGLRYMPQNDRYVWTAESYAFTFSSEFELIQAPGDSLNEGTRFDATSFAIMRALLDGLRKMKTYAQVLLANESKNGQD